MRIVGGIVLSVFMTADVPFKINSRRIRRLRKVRRKMAKAKQEVIIRVWRGVVEVVKVPKNIRVLLRDYDVDGAEDDLKEDDMGQYEETEI
jgi:hypothetical protein